MLCGGPAPADIAGIISSVTSSDFQRGDFLEIPHRSLDRAEPYPTDIADECHSFDPISHSGLLPQNDIAHELSGNMS